MWLLSFISVFGSRTRVDGTWSSMDFEDIHVVCLVGWTGRVIFLFGWMDEIACDENT